MHDEYLKLSQFLDNELEHKQSLQLLDQLASDQMLDEKFRRYGAVSQAIKTEVFLSLSDDFVSQVNEQIQAEPIHFRPPTHRRKYQILSYSAIAASLAVVSVILIKNKTPDTLIVENPLTIAENSVNPSPSNRQPTLATTQTQDQNNESIQMVAGSRDMNKPVTRPPTRLQPVNPKFDDYLQAHSGNLYSSGADFQTYAQVASFGQE